jgi:hypothetical protein
VTSLWAWYPWFHSRQPRTFLCTTSVLTILSGGWGNRSFYLAQSRRAVEPANCSIWYQEHLNLRTPVCASLDCNRGKTRSWNRCTVQPDHHMRPSQLSETCDSYEERHLSGLFNIWPGIALSGVCVVAYALLQSTKVYKFGRIVYVVKTDFPTLGYFITSLQWFSWVSECICGSFIRCLMTL